MLNRRARLPVAGRHPLAEACEHSGTADSGAAAREGSNSNSALLADPVGRHSSVYVDTITAYCTVCYRCHITQVASYTHNAYDDRA